MLYNKETTKQRNTLTQKIRDFFNENNFTEVETPIMTPMPGMEPHLTPFETNLTQTHKPTIPLYLNTSPELQMKKLLAAGFGDIYNITKVFRNGEIGGSRHNPEFTMLEWYRTGADYKDLMKDCEELISLLDPRFTPPFEKISVHEAFLKYCDIDLLENKTEETFRKTAEAKGHSTEACQDWDDIFFKIFLNDIEPKLGFQKPTILYDYPASQAALAKKSPQNPFWAERFELYIAGLELANAYSELIDAKEQRERLKDEQNLRKKLKKTIFDIDEEFLASLESIQKPTAGIALGLDRLFMILLNIKSIEELLLFPLTKLINK